MNLKHQYHAKSPTFDKQKGKIQTRFQEPSFKIIVPPPDPPKRHQYQDLTIKEISSKFGLKNDSGSTTTHSSNNQGGKSKLETSNSKLRLHGLSHSPINYQDLKTEKDLSQTPGLIKSNILARKNNPVQTSFDYSVTTNEKKFEDLCYNEPSNPQILDRTIEELKRQNRKMKASEKKMAEKIEKLEKENNELKTQLRAKGFVEARSMKSSAPNSIKPVMVDETAQVFIPEENESFDLSERTFLLSQVAILEEKLDFIETAFKSSRTQNVSLITQKSTMNSTNDPRSEELENTIRELFLKNKTLEMSCQELKNEKQVLASYFQEKKCAHCQKEEEENSKAAYLPIPGYLKLLKMAQEGITKR